ncbi:MAG: ornithine cyclodeaminase [Clostridiaceae bacterium]|nr:ornithine cyclodeaminase [Clostridiaceae bacterium]
MDMTEILFLNEQEMIKAGVLDSARCVDVLDEMFQLLGKGDYVLGGPRHNEHGIKISFPEKSEFPNMPLDGPDRRFMAMVGYLGGRFNVCGEKWYGSNIINPQRGLPRSVLITVLNDPDTCEPFAIMSANLVSAVRTGAVPGVGVRYLARKGSEVCAIIGAGPVSKACFQAIYAEAKELKEIIVYDLFPEKSAAFIEWSKKELGIGGIVAKSTEEAVRHGDIISVAASAVKPVDIKDEWVKKGSLIIATGNCELEESYMFSSKIVYDNPLMWEAYMQDAKEIPPDEKPHPRQKFFDLIEEGKLPPFSDTLSLGKITIGAQKGRENDEERIFLGTSGIPAEDVAWSYECYLKAKELGLGTKLQLWPDKPYWV